MSAGGVAIATDQEQQLALVLMWPYSEYHMMQNAARCRDMEQYLSVWKPHTANTSPHDIPLVSVLFVPSLHPYYFYRKCLFFFSFCTFYASMLIAFSH